MSVLRLLVTLEDHLFLLLFERSLLHDSDLESLLVRILTEHTLHLECTHTHSQVGTETTLGRSFHIN